MNVSSPSGSARRNSCIGVACRLPQLVFARVPIAVAEVVSRGGGEDHHLLRHHCDTLANVGGIGVAKIDSVEQDSPGLRIVKTFGQLEDRGFACARGSDHGEPFASADAEREIDQRRRVGTRRIMEGHLLERERSRRRFGQRNRLCRRSDVRFGMKQFGQALGSARGAQQVAIDFGQVAERAGEQPAVEHERGDRAAGDPPRRDLDRSVPDDQSDGAENDEDDNRGHERTHEDSALRGRENPLDGVGEARRLAALLVERLDDLHRAEHFAGDGTHVGDAVLAAGRDRAHSAPEDRGREDDDHRREHDH